MFIGEKLIYLELHKTGCSHILKLIQSTPSCKGFVYGKHNTIYEVPSEKLGDIESKVKAGNVRNPWDWYVSLWAFGCMGEGGLRGRVTSSFLKKLRKPWLFFVSTKKWERIYADVNNPELFREWVKMLFAKNTKKDIGKGFGTSKVSNFIGLMTYRYFRLYNYNFDKKKNTINNYKQLTEYDKKNFMLDVVLKNEKLDEDFKTLMLKLNTPASEIEANLGSPKTNTSKRDNYYKYYDEETKNIIGEREKFIIEKHNYQY